MRYIILIIFVLAVLALVIYAVTGFDAGVPNERTLPNGRTPIENGSEADEEPNAALVDTISLAMLDNEGASGGPMRGCDHVVMVEREIEPTTAPLTAAMENLFAIENETVEGWMNFIARTNGTLSFERATVENGTAHIYLTGELSGLAGVCDDPRAAIQIEETALQFATVDEVQLYLNGDATVLTPSQQ